MPTSIDTELVASSLVGLVMIGVIIRNAILGWYEARIKMKTPGYDTASVTSVFTSWEHDKIEEFLRLTKSIADNLTSIAQAQTIMADQFQKNTQDKLDDLFDQLENMKPSARAKPTRRRTKSTG